jgi:hypothetical protein
LQNAGKLLSNRIERLKGICSLLFRFTNIMFFAYEGRLTLEEIEFRRQRWLWIADLRHRGFVQGLVDSINRISWLDGIDCLQFAGATLASDRDDWVDKRSETSFGAMSCIDGQTCRWWDRPYT